MNISTLKETGKKHTSTAAYIGVIVALIGFVDNRCAEHAREREHKFSLETRHVLEYDRGSNYVNSVIQKGDASK